MNFIPAPKKSFLISCVVPVYNEEKNITNFITALKIQLQQLGQSFEIIVVDDGSYDHTSKKVIALLKKDRSIKLLSFSRHFGKENALTAGLERSSGDCVIMIDADFQHPVELISTFVQYWIEGYDIVYGIQKNRPRKSLLKNYLPRLFYFLINKFSKINIMPDAGDFRLLDRKVVNALNSLKEYNRFMKGLYAWVGFKSKGIPCNTPKRRAGKSTFNLSQLTELAITGLTSFSDAPLRILSFSGFILSFIALICAIYIIIKTLILGIDVPGYATIVVIIIFFGGIQLFSIGILGEYIARIFTEVKHRPHYIISKEYGFE
ncbi:MAG: glycosyltransferase family 2 protein [Gammaproteobacteria bacterium]|nr:glycosyltransferase family 2 protein [Gammaproteobacteria bacterium]